MRSSQRQSQSQSPSQSRARTTSATATAISLLAAALLAATPADSSTSARAARAPAHAAANAHAAGTFTLNESGSLRLTSKHGFTLNEQGTATGTVKGTIYVRLKIVSSKRVTAEITIYPRNGSIAGFGSAGYRRQTTFASFSGTMAIQRGSGSYSRARGSGLSFSGTIQRSNDAVTVHVSGRVSD